MGLLQDAPRAPKYGNRNVTLDGITFDSVGEAARWCDLRNLQRAGHISALERQVLVPLLGRDGPLKTDRGNPMHWKADFVYMERGQRVYEDFKGFKTPGYLLKKAILAAQGIIIRETGR